MSMPAAARVKRRPTSSRRNSGVPTGPIVGTLGYAVKEGVLALYSARDTLPRTGDAPLDASTPLELLARGVAERAHPVAGLRGHAQRHARLSQELGGVGGLAPELDARAVAADDLDGLGVGILRVGGRHSLSQSLDEAPRADGVGRRGEEAELVLAHARDDVGGAPVAVEQLRQAVRRGAR